jgi:hypothetical protein
MLSLLLFAELVIASLRRRKYSLALSILLLLRFLIIRELVDIFFFVVLNVIEFLVISDDGPACGCCCCSVSRGMLTATRQTLFVDRKKEEKGQK